MALTTRYSRPGPQGGLVVHHATSAVIGHRTMSTAGDIRCDRCPRPGCTECAAQWNYVATSGLAYQTERNLMGQALLGALNHGLTITDLIAASGLSLALVTALLKQAGQ